MRLPKSNTLAALVKKRVKYISALSIMWKKNSFLNPVCKHT